MKWVKTTCSSMLLMLTSVVVVDLSVSCALAAVDVQDLPGHERRRLEIEDPTDHILDLAHPADGVQRAHPGVGARLVYRRFDHAQRDGIHPQTSGGILDRKRFGDRD